MYLHSKGVSKVKSEPILAWVKYLCYFNIKLGRDCLKVLDQFNLCGTEWYGNHYRGNFWWANSQYIRTLPSSIGPSYTDPEFWIAKGDMTCRSIFHFYFSNVYPYGVIIEESSYTDLQSNKYII